MELLAFKNDTKNKIIIYSVLGTVIWESEKETIKEAAEEKNKRDADLYCADLRGADLCGANLRGANLRDANLYCANLRDADLCDADLRDANLCGANLRGANLRDANLYCANLRDADLCDADLRDANLCGANLYRADLRGTNLCGANLRDANLCDANLYRADLRGTNLCGANLYRADLWQLPKDFIDQCSRDILSIFSYLTKEVPFLKKKLLKGLIDGSQYQGTCACLIGTLANGDGGIEKVCQTIPFYEKGTHNYGEMWFLNIKKGDTPENNQFSAHVLELIKMHEKGKFHTITYEPTAKQLKEFEEKRKELIK